MQRRLYTVMLMLLVFPVAGAAQSRPVAPLFLPPHARGYLPLVTAEAIVVLPRLLYSSSPMPLQGRITPTTYYDQHFGFFCKNEWKLEQRAGVPIKFRLGSYQQAQLQEGKH